MSSSVHARPAASLLLYRQGDGGAEILMGMRGAGHRFMPNRLVFPGGAVDPADHTAPCAAPLPAHAMRRLQKAATAGEAHALGMAAARELAEETGLSLGVPPVLDGLDFLCRAITPAAAPMRFDARFFTAEAARAEGALAGDGELEDLMWYALEAALALDLALATRGVLLHFTDWLALSPASRGARDEVPVLRERVWVIE